MLDEPYFEHVPFRKTVGSFDNWERENDSLRSFPHDLKFGGHVTNPVLHRF
ncbi:hypothetical protein Poly51_09210 [Rubripirellula tenax]|uniref:Uncharacterized protein n=1 Tax=Rubripirellula tenax TaxID=2528015 RepID=A0A5C6FMB7_9BACT|nr:hypothetical protein Poly51_09210 [Rubripirellula tenax]